VIAQSFRLLPQYYIEPEQGIRPLFLMTKKIKNFLTHNNKNHAHKVARYRWAGYVDKEIDTYNSMDMQCAKSGYTSFIIGVLMENVSKYLNHPARLNS
jgi:hypothetical protein